MTSFNLAPASGILPLNSPLAGLNNAGGKGANLARLAQAGFPVPPGFILPTAAYLEFVRANRLEAVLAAALTPAAPGAEQLETLSAEIRARFAAGEIPPALAGAILEAYRGLGAPPVAVRSSATAEDLPDLSFAGQQDTILNVRGEEALLRAVVQCWSSLWTARAIGYRARNQIDPRGLALAVVVQRMVESHSAGVLFTANPLSGLRDETVIDAAFGLGEALVSGLVEPDQYIVDPAGKIRAKTLGQKALSIHGLETGGTRQQQTDRSTLQALPDEQILELARLGRQAAERFGGPQDIEWSWAEGCLYLLQARPVTSLYPLPDNLPAEPLQVLFSFGAIQGLLDPITPIGDSAMRVIFAAGAGLFGYRVNGRTQTAFYTAGERLWANPTPLIRNSFGRKAIHTALRLIEPSIAQAMTEIWDDPRLQPGRAGVSLAARLHLARFFLPLAGNVLLNLCAPARRRESILSSAENILVEMREQAARINGSPAEKLARRAALLEEVCARHLPSMFTRFISAVAAGMASWNLIRQLNPQPADEAEWNRLSLEISRAVPHNPTTTMDFALWEIARDLRADPAAAQALTLHSSHELAALYQRQALPEQLQTRVGAFLVNYGGRGLGEIDLGRARWEEEPAHIFAMLASFNRIQDPAAAPDAVYYRGEQAALAAAAELEKRAHAAARGLKGRLRVPLLRFFIKRARQWMGLRESPKFFAVRMLAIVRREILRSSAELAQSGLLDQPDDLLFLGFDEIRAFAADLNGVRSDTRALIAARRQAHARELRRVQIPRLLLTDGRAYYDGLRSDNPDAITGSPVSPGSARGHVRVVFVPGQANLQPGEILVCPGTDPSWTPLFLSAAGLITEVGGMMTHGAVVAREYGIPAVVGVHTATQRLQTGMLIQLDGASGRIEILPEE